tara:strand:- start:110 stop:391 length:282 start_codon:yes stop_codon:yes gene_type:complete
MSKKAKPKKPTIKELAAGVLNNHSNLNLLANYINDYIQFNDDKDKFSIFLRGKYERMKSEQTDSGNTEGDRKDKPGNNNSDTKSSEPGEGTKK